MWHRLASLDINILHFKVQVNTLLILLDILADEFAKNVVGPVCNLRSEDARGVGSKDGALRCVGGVVQDTGLVVVDSLEFLERGKVAAPFLGVY